MLDITAQTEGEEALRMSNDDLELRVLDADGRARGRQRDDALEIARAPPAEEALRVAQRQYRELVEDLPAVVYSWESDADRTEELDDRARRCRYTSPQIEVLLGYTPDEWARGTSGRNGSIPTTATGSCALADRCAVTGEPFTAEYRYLAKDGRVVWVLDRATLRARDHRGRPAHFQGVDARHHGAQGGRGRRPRTAEERYRQLAEQGPMVSYVYGLRPDGRSPPSNWST